MYCATSRGGAVTFVFTLVIIRDVTADNHWLELGLVVEVLGCGRVDDDIMYEKI